jgi:hypothetical protein
MTAGKANNISFESTRSTSAASKAYWKMSFGHDLVQLLKQPFLHLRVGRQVAESEGQRMSRGLMSSKSKNEGVSTNIKITQVSIPHPSRSTSIKTVTDPTNSSSVKPCDPGVFSMADSSSRLAVMSWLNRSRLTVLLVSPLLISCFRSLIIPYMYDLSSLTAVETYLNL